jgi:hypothetical protein
VRPGTNCAPRPPKLYRIKVITYVYKHATISRFLSNSHTDRETAVCEYCVFVADGRLWRRRFEQCCTASGWHAFSNTNAGAHGFGKPHGNAYVYSHINPNGYTDCNAHRNTNCEPHRNANGYPNGDANSNTHRVAAAGG